MTASGSRRPHAVPGDGTIPDLAEAVASPQRLSTDVARARRLLDLVPAFPAVTRGRDELHAGKMWNSNSLTAWLLARSGHHAGEIQMPVRGRAPGWSAGLVVAATQDAATVAAATQAQPPIFRWRLPQDMMREHPDQDKLE